MKLSDIKIGERFGYAKAAGYFGEQAACVWTRVSRDTIQQDGREPVDIKDPEADVYTLADED